MAPRNIIGTLWERPVVILLLLLPMATAHATPDTAEHMWTTVPPAKSCAGNPSSVIPSERNPPNQTMCAMGA